MLKHKRTASKHSERNAQNCGGEPTTASKLLCRMLAKICEIRQSCKQNEGEKGWRSVLARLAGGEMRAEMGAKTANETLAKCRGKIGEKSLKTCAKMGRIRRKMLVNANSMLAKCERIANGRESSGAIRLFSMIFNATQCSASQQYDAVRAAENMYLVPAQYEMLCPAHVVLLFQRLSL